MKKEKEKKTKKIDIDKMSKETGIEKKVLMFYLGTIKETGAKTVKEARNNFLCAPEGSFRQLSSLKRWISLSLKELATINSIKDFEEKTKFYPDYDEVDFAVFKKWLELSGEKEIEEITSFFNQSEDNHIAKKMIIEKIAQFY